RAHPVGLVCRLTLVSCFPKRILLKWENSIQNTGKAAGLVHATGGIASKMEAMGSLLLSVCEMRKVLKQWLMVAGEFIGMKSISVRRRGQWIRNLMTALSQ